MTRGFADLGRRSRILLALILFTIPPGAAVAVDDNQPAVHPDPAIQAAIARVVDARTREQQHAGLDQLVELDTASHQQLVRQLVYFASRAQSTKDAMVVGVVIRRMDIPDATIARALVPCLDTTDRALDESVRNILGGLEKRAAGRRPDFSIYREIIADHLRAGEQLPDGLIRYMYDADPGVALLTLMRAHQLREPEELKVILWAEHVVSDVLWKQQYGFLNRDEIEPAAARELARLSNHNEWWVRLYVAEIMRQQPGFRQPGLIGKLINDRHQVVQAAAINILDQP